MFTSHQLKPPSSQPPSPDFIAIAAMLNEAAQALRAAGRSSEVENEPEKETAPRDEIRRYRFPRLAVQCEQELFEDQGAENLQEVLFNACSSLKAFTALLERIDPEAELDGVVLHLLARELKRVGDLLFKIQDAYSTVERVEA